MSGDFVHLHTHSEYSLLDGLGRVKELVKEAKRLGQPALAITDHGAMHGAIEFFRACRDAEIKPIIGLEAYQTVWGRPMGGRDSQLDRENYHLLLLAQNMTGYHNLLKISSHSHTDGFYYRPRVDHQFLAAHSAGLIATTGCLGAEIPQLLSQGKEQEAYARMGWYVETFGRENFYIELQEHKIPELVTVNRTLVPWAKKFGLQLLATNDIHYVREEEGGPHDVLLCVQTGARLNDAKRMRLSDGSYFMKSRAQMEETFRPLMELPPAAFDSSLAIAEMCQVDLEDSSYHLPDMAIPEGHTYGSYLRLLTERGLQERYGARASEPAIQERKETELRIIGEMGFDVYFLIVADLCDFARSRNIWWNVRGSGAGSIVAYCIGITGLDPLKNNLIFERFLNPGRVTMPDFDLDYPDDQREELIRYTVDKYGSAQVAQIVTFGRMKARAAIRDVGRTKEIPLHEVDRIAKLIPAIPGKPVTIQDVLTAGHEFYNQELVQLAEQEGWVRDLLETSMQLEGVARHSGIHAAAVIVSDRELTHYTPLMRGSKSTVTESVTQYEFPILESIGLLKIDFLGLSTLSVMREAAQLIQRRHGVDHKLDTIPFEGQAAAAAFRLLSSGEVSGVFQVESQGMRRVLTEMQPTSFEHIVATISLYRPGPLEYIPQFIRRLHGAERVEYKHPKLESILGETYGICVYQEQIIQILSELAGYSPGEADLVRRAVSKKKASDIEYHKQLFVEGCARNGVPPEAATAIYADIEFFARYGFNKSHAADYAVITVQTAYLKAHYPVEYMAALLLIERDKTEKVVTFISECRRMGIQVLPPDVNYSDLDFEIQQVPPDSRLAPATRDPGLAYPFPVPADSAIRFGMAAVKNVGEGPVQAILAARTQGGPFADLEDFCDRVDLRQVTKRALECLIKVGALDRFGRRSQLLEALDQIVARSAGIHSAKASGQLSMFDLLGDAGLVDTAPILLADLPELKGRERLQAEKELLGVYASSHPLQQVEADLESVVTCSCAALDEQYDEKNVVMAGMIAGIRQITTKKGDAMAFVQLEDLQGQCEVVVFPRTYAEIKELLAPENVILVKGKAQTREGRTSVLADVVQNYVERASFAAAEGEGPLQKSLLPLPTIHGIAAAPDNEGDETDQVEDNQVEDKMSLDHEESPPPAAETFLAAERVPEPPPWLMETPEMESWYVESSPQEDGPPPSAPSAQGHGMPNGRREPAAPPDPPARAEGAAVEATPPRAPVSTRSSEQPRAGNEAPSAENGRAAPSADNGFDGAARQDAQPTPLEPGPAETVPEPAQPAFARPGSRCLTIRFHRSGNLSRDKFRLKEIYDRVRDPRGRDRFVILIEADGQRHQLAFPNDPCSISERLVTELEKHFRVEVTVADTP